MSAYIPITLAARVRRRAKDTCEYCLLPQWTQEAAFHFDHVLPIVDGGRTEGGNLALACVTCSLKKGSRTLVRDPRTGAIVPLFNPRRDRWNDHFLWTVRWRVAARTPTGRATVRALGMNRPAVVLLRQVWAALGMFPDWADDETHRE